MIPTYNPHARRTKAGSSSRTDARLKSHAVRHWIEACFREVSLDWNDYTETDRTYASPYRRLVSDPAKLLSLGWKPECTFSRLAAMMMAEAARRCEVSEQMSRVGMRGAFTPCSTARMPMHRAPMLGSMGRMQMHRAPMMNSALGLRRFNRFNDGDFDRDDRFRRFDRFKEIIFIGDYGFPWWLGPWWGWNWGYPYGSYPSDYSGYGYGNYGYGYGSSGYDYGYGYPSASYYGNYYSATDDGSDDESAVRNVLAEYAVSWNRKQWAEGALA